MSPRIKELLGNFALAGGTLVVALLALEFVVFRYILVPDDVLRNVTINQVVRYQPNAKATFRHPDGSSSRVTINAQGWNSTRKSYEVAKPANALRVAVVGDSYVHGAFLDPDKGFPMVIERQLRAKGHKAEVYQFGMDGAPLSQYLHVLRREVVKYQPDIVVVPLIHNDFDESYRFLKTRYASSFMKLHRNSDGDIEEITPATFKGGLSDKLRASSMFRYIYYETGLYLRIKGFVSKYFWGGKEEWTPEFISSAVDIRKIRDHRSNEFFARYVLAEMKSLSDEYGFKLVVAMDGVREAIYERKSPSQYEVWKLNEIAAKITRELGLPFVQLQEVFRRDYIAHGERLEFEFDWHWNVRGNELVGRSIARLIEDQLPVLEQQRKTASAAKSKLLQ